MKFETFGYIVCAILFAIAAVHALYSNRWVVAAIAGFAAGIWILQAILSHKDPEP